MAEAQRGPERPREAQKGGSCIEQACHALGWRLSTSRFSTRQAPHIYLQIHTYVCYPRGCPHGLPLCSQGSKQKSMSNPGPPTSRITTREVPHPQNYDQALHKQNYDQGAYILPTSRITTRELASWLAGWLGGLRPGNLSCAWLAGWLAGGLAGWPAEA